MSTVPELDLDLENLFQPAWAQPKAETNRYESFTGNEESRPERRSGERQGGPGGPRGPRHSGPSRAGEREGRRPGGRGGREGAGGGPRSKSGRGFSREDSRRQEPPAPIVPPPDISVAFVPDDKGVDHLARQIKITGRAYPLFQIAQLVLQKPERYSVQLASRKKADGGMSQNLYVCALDESPWLNEEDALAHALRQHFATFYQAERTATEPPKGTYTFVAQCGMSGVILGPPNYHDYQNQLRKLHAERFSRMPFDAFKARVKIVKDEAVVKKWIEEQSFKTEYNCLNVPEPLKLPSMEAVEQHFRTTYKESMVKVVDTLVVAGVASRALRCGPIQRLVRAEWEHQRHFPIAVATKLSQQFASRGLQFFKVNKTVTHVAVARPQFLDLEASPVSENIRRIVESINSIPKCTRKKLLETLAPAPAAAGVPVVSPETPSANPTDAVSTPPAGAESGIPTPPPPTAEQTAVVADLHWLVHQGHVLEFADGRLETAKKPLPRPAKPEKIATTKTSASEDVAVENIPQAQVGAGVAEMKHPSETVATAEGQPASTTEMPADPAATVPTHPILTSVPPLPANPPEE